jgi:hypothetical protein
MLKRLAVAAALAALAFGPARAESQDKAADALQLELTAKTPSFKVRRPNLVFNGGCALSDGIILKVNLSKAGEAMSGNEIVPSYVGMGGGTAELISKKFSYNSMIDGPGKFVVQISLVEELQERHLAAEIKKKAGDKKTFQREFLVWGDELIGTLPPKLNELHALVTESREMVKKFERATMSKEGWGGESKGLAVEGGKLQNRLQNHELMAYYPAAVNNLFFTVRNVVNNAPYFTFGADGKFSGASDYHADNKKVATFRNEDYNWENLKRYVEETGAIGGREFCLWVIKELRRTAGQMRPDIIDAIKSQKAAPGVDVFQERLQKATIADIDTLEAEIRGTPGAKKPAGQ